MKALILLLLLGPASVVGQPFEHGPVPMGTALIGLPKHNPDGFARAVKRGNIHAIDRWMKRELMAKKRGEQLDNGSSTYTVHTLTYKSIVDWLKKQPGVIDAAWDGCMGKLDIWPGHSTIGLRVMLNGVEHERCYRVQEGRPGTITFFGWRPRIRKSREQLKYLGADDRPGFVRLQHKYCEDQQR